MISSDRNGRERVGNNDYNNNNNNNNNNYNKP